MLQELFDKAKPRRLELTKEEQPKLEKLNGILDTLRRGQNVQNRQLHWLSDDEYAQIAAEWNTQKLFREELRDKPSELKRYKDKLKEAIMMRNRSDSFHRKGKKAAAYKLDSKCESLCEDSQRYFKKLLMLMLACRFGLIEI